LPTTSSGSTSLSRSSQHLKGGYHPAHFDRRLVLRSALGAAILFVGTSIADNRASIEKRVHDYYAGLLEGRVVAYEIDLRRVPELKPASRMTGVRGEENGTIPRGSRVCWIEVEESGRERLLPVTLNVKTVERVPVAALPIEPRTALGSGHVRWEERATTSLGAAQIPSADDLSIGWSKVRIAAGSLLTSSKVAPRPAVMIGEEISLVLRSGAIELRTTGRALEDGRIGERVRVRNLESGVRLNARVTGPKEVELE